MENNKNHNKQEKYIIKNNKEANKKDFKIVLGIIIFLVVLIIVLLNFKKNDDGLDVLEEKNDKAILTDKIIQF